MIIGTLAVIGFFAGVDQFCREDRPALGLWAMSICSCAFALNLVL